MKNKIYNYDKNAFKRVVNENGDYIYYHQLKSRAIYISQCNKTTLFLYLKFISTGSREFLSKKRKEQIRYEK